MPNDLYIYIYIYISRTAPLTSKRCILYIYSTNTGTEYFKHALYYPSFSLQNPVCFIMLTCLVPVLFTFYIQDVLKLKKNNSGAKELMDLGHLLTRSGLTYPEVSSKVYHDSFSQLGSSMKICDTRRGENFC